MSFLRESKLFFSDDFLKDLSEVFSNEVKIDQLSEEYFLELQLDYEKLIKINKDLQKIDHEDEIPEFVEVEQNPEEKKKQKKEMKKKAEELKRKAEANKKE